MEPAVAAAASPSAVASTLASDPVIGVVRTDSTDTARDQARRLLDTPIGLVEITFTVPSAVDLVRELRQGTDLPWIGMGSVTTAARAREAVAAGADFLVSPNASPEVAAVAHESGRFLVMGALTPTEIVSANELGAHLVKVYPLPAVGGAAYLRTVRGPLWDIDMLAAGGFGVDEISDYRAAGARAFGMMAPMLLEDDGAAAGRALALARGESS